MNRFVGVIDDDADIREALYDVHHLRRLRGPGQPDGAEGARSVLHPRRSPAASSPPRLDVVLG